MKSIKFFAVASAVALLGTTGFTSCNQKNGPDGPGTYNGETVKTEFSISIPEVVRENNGGILYMPGKNVQRTTSEFQGMTGITLIPFAEQTPTSAPTDPAISGTNTRLGNNITLGEIAATSELGTNSKAKLYSDVAIPLSTGSFLFYAKSKSSASDKFEKGSLVSHFEDAKTTPNAFTFDLEPINSTASIASSTQGSGLLAYLNTIVIAENGSSKKWYEITTGDDAVLFSMFQTFKTLNRLSSFAVARVLTDLYNSLYPLAQASNTLATNIRGAINNSTYVTVSGSTDNCTVALKTGYDNFPKSDNLPEGAFAIEWNTSTNKFVEEDDYTSRAAQGMANPGTYTYPAELWYYANSAIVTSNASQRAKYDNSNDWAAILSYHTDGDQVKSLTRAVAINSVIQYAVARLDVDVKLAASSLADNSEHAVGTATAVDCTAGFPVTAVLVGGQKQVGFDFTPKGSDSYTIYDSIMTSGRETVSPTQMKAISGSYSAVNSTLVLENGNEDVMIAVEMVNKTGKDFYGYADQLIPNNGKFYVVAKLQVASPTTSVVSGKVFKQDFTTFAHLTLQNLKNTYNTIPDLRSPELELGFSVDLSWQDGNVYTVNFD